MQVAQVLSDLTSLQVCDANAAMALVRARPSTTASTPAQKQDQDAQDPDLARAKDLFELHSTMKVAHQDGTDAELTKAREAVARVMRDL